LFRSALACGDCCTPALPWGDLPVAAFLTRCKVQPRARILDHGQELRRVMNDIDRDPGDLPRAGTGSGQGTAEVGEYLAGLGRQVAGADQVALRVLGFLVGDVHGLASGRDNDMGVGSRNRQALRG